MAKSLRSVQKPETRFDVIRTEKYGKPVVVRIMLMKYDNCIEVYYQEEGYPFEYAYGVPGTAGWGATMGMAMANVIRWGLHYEE